VRLAWATGLSNVSDQVPYTCDSRQQSHGHAARPRERDVRRQAVHRANTRSPQAKHAQRDSAQRFGLLKHAPIAVGFSDSDRLG
jgi:hypothetical protein